MNTSNATHTASEFQVSPPALSSWPRIVRDRPILRDVERSIKELDPPATTDQFWCKWNTVEHRLAEIFDGELRPEIGTDHATAWNHLFVLLDDLTDGRYGR